MEKPQLQPNANRNKPKGDGKKPKSKQISEKWSNLIISKFLAEYKKYPVLWDMNLDEYKKRDSKEAAYNDLMSDLRKDPAFLDITIEVLKNKIKILGTTYRQELEKVISNSKKSGAGTEDVYKPHLAWYDDADCFLRECTVTGKRKSNMDNHLEDETSSIDEAAEEEVIAIANVRSSEPEPRSTSSSASTVSRCSTTKKQKFKQTEPDTPTELPGNIDAAISRLETLNKQVNDEDDNVKFGQFVTAQLKKLLPVAALEVQQVITNVLNQKQIEEIKLQHQQGVIIYTYEGVDIDDIS